MQWQQNKQQVYEELDLARQRSKQIRKRHLYLLTFSIYMHLKAKRLLKF